MPLPEAGPMTIGGEPVEPSTRPRTGDEVHVEAVPRPSPSRGRAAFPWTSTWARSRGGCASSASTRPTTTTWTTRRWSSRPTRNTASCSPGPRAPPPPRSVVRRLRPRLQTGRPAPRPPGPVRAGAPPVDALHRLQRRTRPGRQERDRRRPGVSTRRSYDVYGRCAAAASSTGAARTAATWRRSSGPRPARSNPPVRPPYRRGLISIDLVVVGAAIIVGGRLLSAQRAEPPHMAGGWSCRAARSTQVNRTRKP